MTFDGSGFTLWLLKRSKRCVAVDVGAESGRVVLGLFDGRTLALKVVHRFRKGPVRLLSGLHWNALGLFDELLQGLRAAGPFESLGVDTWGCDYALLDQRGALLGTPLHYRDRRTIGAPRRAFDSISSEELYVRTGIQPNRFNTIFQLLADTDAGVPFASVDRIAMIPDLLVFWLTGVLVTEGTVASTTGLADTLARAWAVDLVERLGLPTRPFRHALVQPGLDVGVVGPLYGLGHFPLVRTVASHDTASAFVGTPIASKGAAVISCGTWSLVGFEVGQPQLSSRAAAYGLSNEWGIDRTIRLLRNVTGLWLLEECRREWQRKGLHFDYEKLELMASQVSDEVAVFDPDLEVFEEPGAMLSRIAAVCREAHQPVPETPAEFTRAILLSLACKYKLALDGLVELTGHPLDVVHLVGGGSRNDLLCRLTADIVGVPVLAGPHEAAAAGNILVQLRAAGEFDSLEGMRDCVRESLMMRYYEPLKQTDVYERFLASVACGDPFSVAP